MREFGKSHLMIAGRGLVLFLIIAGLLLPGPGNEPENSRVLVLVDQSDRLTSTAIARAREQIAADLKPFAKDLVIDTFDFGKEGGLAETVSDALQESLWRLEPQDRNGIVIASDGQWAPEVESLLSRMREAGIPAYWLAVMSDGIKPRITRIDAPARARAGQRIQASIEAEVPGTGSYFVELFSNDEPVGRLSLAGNERAVFPLTVPAGGAMRLDVDLHDEDTGQAADRLRAGALVNIASAPELLIIARGYSPIAASLAAGGWSITQILPNEFAGLDAPTSRFSALILDDIAATDMATEDWLEITDAVRNDALGLLVLGGPGSFGLGAYRESILEQVLPVVSEPPEDETPASIFFLVDISGSMGRQPGGIEGLRTARDAVLFTASALRPADRVGLIAFDVESRLLLAPTTRDDHAAAINRVWPGQASGGTSVIPALDLAQAAFAKEQAEQKILLLVTDGMLKPDELRELQIRLSTEDLEVIVMIVSDGQTDAPLSRVELSDRVTLLMIDDVLRLPVLMRNEVENLRTAVVTDRTRPVVISAPPVSGLSSDWPSLDAFVLTRARPEATVMLAGNHGEPLLAAWTAGAGRVVTLTGGLNQWATDWLEWSHWPVLAAGLMNHIAVTDSGSTRPHIDNESSNRLSIVLDTGDVQEMTDSLRVRLLPPAGPQAEVALIPEAPGRYQASVTVDQAGQYTLVWESGAGVHRYSFVHRLESDRTLAVEPIARRFLEDGLLEEWNENSAAQLVQRWPLKSTLIILALAFLLMTIAAERVPFPRRKK